MTPPIISLRNISKSYPSVKALQNVNFECRKGEIHALMGENGAGKSTLLKIIYGVHCADSGSYQIDGQEVALVNPHDALDLGISMVHQELNIVPNLSVADNVLLGAEISRFGIINRSSAGRLAQPHLRALGFQKDPRTKAGTLSTAEQQLVEIARVLLLDHRLIILDEPTASIGYRETGHLLGIIERLRDEGRSIVFVSHRLSDITRLKPDRITVLRDGQLSAALTDNTEVDEDEIIRLMVGRDIDNTRARRIVPDGEPFLRLIGLTREPGFRGVSLSVRPGEILGVAGMIGSGRTELMRGICGLEPATAGEIRIAGQAVRIGSMAGAMRHGIVLVPEDRKTQGLVLDMSLTDNICLPAPPTRFGVIDRNRQKEIAQSQLQRLRVKGEPGKTARTLSGGNQQKVVLAKWLRSDFKLIIFDEPTRGIDIGAKQEIYTLIEELAQQGRAIIVVSSDLPEIIRLSDRVNVMRNGKIAAEFTGDEIREETIIAVTVGAQTRSRQNIHSQEATL